MGGTGPNRSRFRASVKVAPRSEADHDENWREMLRAYPESLINLDVGAHVRQTTAQTITNNTMTPVEFGTEIEDEYGFYDAVQSLVNLVIPRGLSGRYAVTGRFLWENTSVTNPVLNIQVNGVTVGQHYLGNVFAFTSGMPTAVASPFLRDGDIVSLNAYHNSGVSKASVVQAAGNTFFSPVPALELWRIGVRG